jgi:transcriptional regulator with GAF, ATPase, and Fis domain
MGGPLKKLRDRHRREERELVLEALDVCGWNASVAARELGIAYSSIQRLIDRHGLRKRYDRYGPAPGRPSSSDRE